MFSTVVEQGKFHAIQDDVKNAPFPDLTLDTCPEPLEAKIELWLEREAYSQFSVRRLEISKIYILANGKIIIGGVDNNNTNGNTSENMYLESEARR